MIKNRDKRRIDEENCLKLLHAYLEKCQKCPLELLVKLLSAENIQFALSGPSLPDSPEPAVRLTLNKKQDLLVFDLLANSVLEDASDDFLKQLCQLIAPFAPIKS